MVCVCVESPHFGVSIFLTAGAGVGPSCPLGQRCTRTPIYIEMEADRKAESSGGRRGGRRGFGRRLLTLFSAAFKIIFAIEAVHYISDRATRARAVRRQGLDHWGDSEGGSSDDEEDGEGRDEALDLIVDYVNGMREGVLGQLISRWLHACVHGLACMHALHEAAAGEAGEAVPRQD